MCIYTKPKIKITCYGVTKEFDTRQDAKDTLKFLISNTQGLERDRYMKVLMQLDCGLLECSDEENEIFN